jgi:hypothetical protein
LVLQGTFETLSLPEVLGLLSSARKSGALWLEAGPIAGVAYLEDGQCRAAGAGEQRDPVQGGTALLTRLVELCFAVMCQASGSFRFADDDPAPWTCGEPVELSEVLVEVDRLLKQWREILRVIPSLECRPQLLESLEVDEVVIDRERWALLVAMDGRRTVRELVQRTTRPVIELCQTLLELVEIGAVGVIDPAAARTPDLDLDAPAPTSPDDPAAPNVARSDEVGHAEPAIRSDATLDGAAASEVPVEPSSGRDEPTAAVVLTFVPEPEIEPERGPEPEPDPGPELESDAKPGGGADPPDRGAFLRLFSGLRDS